MRLSFDARPARIVARVTALLVSCVAIVAACTDDGASGTAQGDAGVADGAVGTAICPTVAPDNGATCVLPEGTTCAFDKCGEKIARCTVGLWRYATSSDAHAVCPPKPPDIDQACDECRWPKLVTCTYGSQDCSSADASLNTLVASCVSQKWALEVRPCREPDAGADVQGDAGEDAD